eukprot:12772024-Ditylum_brightwellii.AAC.1
MEPSTLIPTGRRPMEVDVAAHWADGYKCNGGILNYIVKSWGWTYGLANDISTVEELMPKRLMNRGMIIINN